jgi:small GTP-binding protein
MGKLVWPALRAASRRPFSTHNGGYPISCVRTVRRRLRSWSAATLDKEFRFFTTQGSRVEGSRTLCLASFSSSALSQTRFAPKNRSVSTSETTTVESLENEAQNHGLYRLLNEEERRILTDQKDLTALTRQLANLLNVPTRDLDEASQILQNSTFCVVLAGEFNAGKSTVLNALLGEKLLETGAIPTTDSVTIVSAPDASESATSRRPMPTIVRFQHDLPLLQDLTLVDTPGTNAVLVDHTATTLRLLPSADLILFVTSADRPFPESERAMLASISQYRKAIIVVINKMDVLEQSGGDHGQNEKARVVDFVTTHASELLGARPVVIPISARDALASKMLQRRQQASSRVWDRSNFAALETFLQESLTVQTRVRTKLSSPIGVSQGLLQLIVDKLNTQRESLETDVATLHMCRAQFASWKTALRADLERSQQDLMDGLAQQGQRAHVFNRRTNWFEFMYRAILERDRLDQEWQKTQAIGLRSTSTPSTRPGIQQPHSTYTLTETLNELIRRAAESLATKGRAQGQAMIEFLGSRPSSSSKSLVGSVTAASRYEETRHVLEAHLLLAVQKHVTEQDVIREETALLKNWQRLAYASLGLNIGLGLNVVGLASGVLSTGSVLPTSISLVVVQALLLQQGRTTLADRHQALWNARAQHMQEDVQEVCNQELECVDRRIRDGVAPYTRFVETEQQRIEDLTRQCEDLSLRAQQLRNRINKL